MKAGTTVLPGLLVVGLLLGCGASATHKTASTTQSSTAANEQAIRGTFTTFAAAVASKDATAACAQFSPAGRRQYEQLISQLPGVPGVQGAPETCEAHITKLAFSNEQLRGVVVTGETANATMVGDANGVDGPISFEKIGGMWKISSVKFGGPPSQ